MSYTYQLLSSSDFDNYKREEYQNDYKEGILVLTLKKWGEFHDIVKLFKNNSDYIWRGQDKDDLLKSSFYRYDNYKKVGIHKLFNNFKEKLSNLRDV